MPQGLSPAEQEALGRLKAAKAARQPRQEEPIPPMPERQKREGIGENPLEDAVNFVKALGHGLLYVPERLTEIVRDPKAYGRELDLLFRKGMLKESGSIVLDAMTENWKDDEGNWAFGEALAKRPISSLSDLFALKAMVVRSGMLGAKIAGGASRAKIAADLAAKLPAMKGADRVLAMLEAVDKAPWPQIGKGLSKMVPESVKNSFGIGKHTPMMGSAKAHEYSAEALEGMKNIERLAYKHLTPEEATALRKAIRIGAIDDIALLSPNAKKWYDAVSNIVGSQESFIKGRGLLTDARAIRANAIAAALELYGTVKRPQVREMERLIRAGKIHPIYASLFRVDKAGWEAFSTLKQDFRRMVGKVSRLEARTGVGTYETDIISTVIKQTKSFHALKARIRFFDRVMDNLQRSGELRIVSRLEDVPDTHLPLQSAIFKKYYEVAQAAGLRLRQLMEEGLSKGKAMEQAFSEIISDPALRRSVAEAKHIAVPKHVARYIEQEFSIPGPVGRVHDRLMGYWKSMATVFRPQYWISVAAGNGIMAALHGAGPEDFARLMKMWNQLPEEIRHRRQLDVQLPGTNVYERVATNMHEYASALDAGLRGVVFSKEVEATRRALLGTGASAFHAFDSMNDPIKFQQLVAAGPETLSQATRGIHEAYERMGMQFPAIRAKHREYLEAIRKAERPGSEASKDLFFSIAADLEYQLKALKANALMDAASAGLWEQRVPKLSQVASWADEAIIAGNRLAGDYQRLLPFEKNWMRRAVPFYAYTKAMTLFVAKLPFIYPRKVFLWNRWSQLVNDMRFDEDYPEWLKEWMPVAHSSTDGGTFFIRMGSVIPWGGIRTAEVGQVPVPGFADLAAQHPVMKFWYELHGGIPRWSKRPISPGENAVRIDNGEVYEWQNGKFRKTIAQPSVWRSLYYMFPVSQMIDNVFVPYTMTDRGWIGYPEAIRRPDGTVMYPKDMNERLLSLLLPSDSKDLEQMRGMERVKYARNVRSYVEGLRRAPPEQREAMIQVLQDNLDMRNSRQEKREKRFIRQAK